MELPKNKLDKEAILKLISKLRKNPNAKYQILADLGIVSAGAAGAGAGAVAAVAGASVAPIGFGISALKGFGIAVAAPVGLVAGVAVAGGATAYGVTQAVRFKARQQGKREQMIRQLEELLRDITYHETKAQTSEADKTQFILFLEEPIRLSLMSSEDASDLIKLVQNGQLTFFEGYRLVKDILKEFQSEQSKNPKILLPRLTQGSYHQVG